jgi:hypothetical protein
MTESTADPPPFGRISTTGDDKSFSADCDALAIKEPRDYADALIVSAVGPQTTIKAVCAVMGNSRSLIMSARNCGPCCPMAKPYERYIRTDGAFGYRVARTKLGYDTWHMLAISEDPQLIPVYSQRAVLDKLKSQRFTTPLLDGWIGWLVSQLRMRSHLRELTCFGCRAGYLNVTDAQLDAIVSEGVRDGHLTISQEYAHV